MATEPMTVPEDNSAAPPKQGTHRRWRWAWLVGLSAVALLVVAGLAVLLAGDDDDAVSSDDVAAAIAVVTEHNDAQNAADRAVMRATMTDDAHYMIHPATADPIVDSTRRQYINVSVGMGDPIDQTFTGEPTVLPDPTGSGDLHVSVPMNLDFGSSWEDVTMVYTLRKVDGDWRIALIDRREESPSR
ncbi:MAG: hypothetical protein WCA82_05460 [Jiangellales bacterium]